MQKDIEEALMMATWSLNNIEDQLKDIASHTSDHPTKWAVANCNANVRLIRGDVEMALSHLKLNKRQRFIKRLLRK